jgi:DNA-binding NarL/FixJ family response regulator
VREALAIRITAQPDLEVCDEAADATEALRLAAAADSDVAVIDIALSTGDGIDPIKRLKHSGFGRHCKPCRVRIHGVGLLSSLILTAPLTEWATPAFEWPRPR